MDPAASLAIADCRRAYRSGDKPDRDIERVAVKHLLSLLRAKAPGRSVEVRIPPYAAAQIVEGVRHTRGNPPASVECGARTFIELCCGDLSWSEAVDSTRLMASGERSDLSRLLPLSVGG